MGGWEHAPIGGPTATLNPMWWEWNERMWGVRARGIESSSGSADAPSLRGAIFIGSGGRVVTPPLMPHMPLGVVTAGGSKGGLGSSQWLRLADGLAETLADLRFAHELVLPTGFIDGRALTWAGLRLGVSYTYAAGLPRESSDASSSVRNKIRKASARGYRASRSDEWSEILACLQETESAKGFSHRLGIDGLTLGARLMGTEAFRGYVVRDSRGHVVSGGIRLHAPGHQAVDWVQGTHRSALSDGVNQLMYDFVMSDLAEAGATGFDLAGANIREVAAAKASWGFPLVPQLTVGRGGLARELRRTLASSTTLRRMRGQAEAVRGSVGRSGDAVAPDPMRETTGG